MEPAESLEALGCHANQLYWESSRSVNRIADDMDLSKGMLYGLIRPLPSELPCPSCATTLEYGNRTARERGLLSCPGCGREALADEVREAWERSAEASAGTEPRRALVVTPRESPPHVARDIEEAPHPRRDPARVGAGLLLVAAGVWLLQGLRKR